MSTFHVSYAICCTVETNHDVAYVYHYLENIALLSIGHVKCGSLPQIQKQRNRMGDEKFENQQNFGCGSGLYLKQNHVKIGAQKKGHQWRSQGGGWDLKLVHGSIKPPVWSRRFVAKFV